MKQFRSMFKTEFLLTMRVLDILIFGICFPVMVAFILGSVYGRENSAMINQTFASVSTIGIAANGLIGLPLTLANYRSTKILKQLRVTPVSSVIVLFVQFSVKLLLSIISSFLVWAVLKFFFEFQMEGNWARFILAYLLVVFAVFGIGMIIASVSSTVNMVNLLCSIVYFPMIFLSGATIPIYILPFFLVKILQVFPLTQGINLLESTVSGVLTNQDFIPFIIMIGIGFLSVIISVKMFKWE